ncbi:MAG: hypothetical protein KDC84_07810 [Crocinitomicaceae bacterium]|nr:hypothetical protein [Crocinitomicaceae bacterium]
MFYIISCIRIEHPEEKVKEQKLSTESQNINVQFCKDIEQINNCEVLKVGNKTVLDIYVTNEKENEPDVRYPLFYELGANYNKLLKDNIEVIRLYKNEDQFVQLLEEDIEELNYIYNLSEKILKLFNGEKNRKIEIFSESLKNHYAGSDDWARLMEKLNSIEKIDSGRMIFYLAEDNNFNRAEVKTVNIVFTYSETGDKHKQLILSFDQNSIEDGAIYIQL